jgi:hypothetical protein
MPGTRPGLTREPHRIHKRDTRLTPAGFPHNPLLLQDLLPKSRLGRPGVAPRLDAPDGHRYSCLSAAIPVGYASTRFGSPAISNGYATNIGAISLDTSRNQAPVPTRAPPYPHHILATSTPDVHLRNPLWPRNLRQMTLPTRSKCLIYNDLQQFHTATGPVPIPGPPVVFPGHPGEAPEQPFPSDLV